IARSGETHLRRASLNRLIEELLHFLGYKLTKAGTKVAVSLDAKIPDQLMDAGQMQQVLLNLIMNASEAMPGGGTLSIRTKLSRDRSLGPCARIIVQDTGRGIPADVIPRLFEAFYTTRSGGTGLGLFISNKLIKRHGGKISVRSEPSEGTTFTVTLPLEPPEGAAE
ncbi:hypothetical protein IT571_05580, partial [Candidatus Sumerlaeota bacterium]|nr:hypothetical protein [Candidatus Sumerlaeota bacterium]